MIDIDSVNRRFSKLIRTTTLSLDYIFNEDIRIFNNVHKHSDYDCYLFTGKSNELKYLAILDIANNDNIVVFANGNINNLIELKRHIQIEFEKVLGYPVMVSGKLLVFSYNTTVYWYPYCSLICEDTLEDIFSIIYIYGDECTDYVGYLGQEEIELYSNILLPDLEAVHLLLLFKVNFNKTGETVDGQIHKFIRVE